MHKQKQYDFWVCYALLALQLDWRCICSIAKANPLINCDEQLTRLITQTGDHPDCAAPIASIVWPNNCSRLYIGHFSRYRLCFISLATAVNQQTFRQGERKFQPCNKADRQSLVYHIYKDWALREVYSSTEQLLRQHGLMPKDPVPGVTPSDSVFWETWFIPGGWLIFDIGNRKLLLSCCPINCGCGSFRNFVVYTITTKWNVWVENVDKWVKASIANQKQKEAQLSFEKFRKKCGY